MESTKKCALGLVLESVKAYAQKKRNCEAESVVRQAWVPGEVEGLGEIFMEIQKIVAIITIVGLTFDRIKINLGP